MFVSDSVSDMLIRQATMSDKGAILSLRKNVYNGLDYLQDYFDFFMQSSDRQCLVGEIHGQIVSLYHVCSKVVVCQCAT